MFVTLAMRIIVPSLRIRLMFIRPVIITPMRVPGSILFTESMSIASRKLDTSEEADPGCRLI
jgi:hypothetical protein